MSVQVQALLAASVLALAAGLGLRAWSWWAARQAAANRLDPAAEPYVLYFTTASCTICRTHQEPALALLEGVNVRRVDALAEPELARRLRIYTVPTTVVVGAEGQARNVNYGYTSAAILQRQLEEAQGSGGASAAQVRQQPRPKETAEEVA